MVHSMDIVWPDFFGNPGNFGSGREIVHSFSPVAKKLQIVFLVTLTEAFLLYKLFVL